MTTQPVDSSILHEIVRIIEARRKVPDKVIVTSKEYLLTYLEDHRHRLEEALMRFDRDRLNMLYGQLASKVKYQFLRRVPARAAAAMGFDTPETPAGKAAGRPAAKKASAAKAGAVKSKNAAPATKASAKKAAAKSAKKAAPARKKSGTAKKVAAKKVSAKKAAPRRAAARPKKKARR